MPARINNQREIAGTLYYPNQIPEEAYWQHFALYRHAKVHDLHSLLPDYLRRSQAIDLNDSGAMILFAEVEEFGGGEFFLYQDGRMISFTNYGDRYLYPLRISDRGDIVGSGMAPEGTAQPFLLTAEGQLHFLGLLPGFHDGVAVGSNQRQVAIGSMVDYDSADAAVRERAVILTTNEMTVIPPLPGDDSSLGVAINDAGLIAAHSGRYGLMTARGVLWDGHNAKVLLLPNDVDSVVVALNNRGEAVGHSYSRPGLDIFSGRAFLYSNGQIYDLAELAGSRFGWTIYQAIDINESGEIVASGIFEGEQHSILLLPKGKSGR